MARIAGVDIPNDKRGEISLTYIYGIGRNRSREILIKSGVDINKKVTLGDTSILTGNLKASILTIEEGAKFGCYAASKVVINVGPRLPKEEHREIKFNYS